MPQERTHSGRKSDEGQAQENESKSGSKNRRSKPNAAAASLVASAAELDKAAESEVGPARPKKSSKQRNPRRLPRWRRHSDVVPTAPISSDNIGPLLSFSRGRNMPSRKGTAVLHQNRLPQCSARDRELTHVHERVRGEEDR